MAKKIIWSLTADNDRRQIIEYWINRNKSNTYSLKLDTQLRELIKLVAETPEIGISTKLPSVRFVISGNYLIYYRIKQDCIEIARIWDSRRNPKSFKL